jgi:hypothetical protein
MEYEMFKQLSGMLSNSTANGDKANMDDTMNSKTIQYFMAMWPVLMSLGLGGSVVHGFY